MIYVYYLGLDLLRGFNMQGLGFGGKVVFKLELVGSRVAKLDYMGKIVDYGLNFSNDLNFTVFPFFPTYSPTCPLITLPRTLPNHHHKNYISHSLLFPIGNYHPSNYIILSFLT
jgi:hypothetical protein